MLFKKIQFKLIQNVNEAEQIWSFLTPHLTIYDEWEFRYCFYKYFNYELFFYVGFINDEPIGLLPLQFNPDKGYLEFFGGSFMNDNRVFIKPELEKYIPKFYKQVNKKAELKYINGSDKFTKKLPIIDYQYTLPLEGLTNSDDYIQKYYKGETKKKLIKRVSEVETLPYQININNFEDLNLMFELNIKKFKENSSFNAVYLPKGFHDLLSSSFNIIFLTYIFQEQKIGASFAILYNDRFVSFNSGFDSEAVKNIDSWARLKRIDCAIKKGAKFFDALSGNLGWKEEWRFTKIPQYKWEHK